ncbi:MAG: hypothetical protein ACOCWC_00835 [Bacteroidota bacterium]
MKKNFEMIQSVFSLNRLKLFARPVLLISIAFVFGLSSCEPDDINYRDKYLGVWSVSEYSELYDSTLLFDVTISASQEDPDEIFIYNFYMMGASEFIYAFVDGNFITIPPQEYCDFTIEGDGTYQSDGEIHMSYTSNDGADEDNLTAVMVKN